MKTHIWTLGVICVTWLLIFVISIPTNGANVNDTSVSVLMYHHLDEEPSTGATISVDKFAQHMQWLADHRYTTITTAQLLGFVRGERDLPPRSVLITFDDGYESNYTYAYPILKEHGLRATIFPILKKTTEENIGLPGLSWEQIREMQRSRLIEFGSHTYDMHHKGEDGRAVMLSKEVNAVLGDLALTRILFYQELDRMPISFTYPFGHYDEEAIRNLQTVGFRIAFTIEEGPVVRGMDPMMLPRYNMHRDITEANFIAAVTGR